MKWRGVRNKLTRLEVTKIGMELDLPFPKDYCTLIGEINGGGLPNAVVEVPEIGKVPYARNINLRTDARGNAILLYNAMKENGLNMFPFGSVGNGDYFCFDLKNWNIVLWMHETGATYKVCKNFTEFLHLIVEQ